MQFKVDWYDSNYPLEAKRSIIKTALEVRRYYGTDWATLKAISAIYPRSEIEQWYDYGGTPGHFRVICSVDGALIPVKRREIRRSVNIYKRMTAHLDSLYLQVQAGIEIECEFSSLVYRVPYASETMYAGTWPKNTTKAALGEVDITVEAEQQSAMYKVETAGTVPDRTTTAGIYDTDVTVETETEVHNMEVAMAGTETCASSIPAVLDEPVLDVDVEVTVTKFKGKRSGEEPFVQ